MDRTFQPSRKYPKRPAKGGLVVRAYVHLSLFETGDPSSTHMSGVRFRLRTGFRDAIPYTCSSERHRNFVRLPAGVLPRLYLSDQMPVSDLGASQDAPMHPWSVLLKHINLMTVNAFSSRHPCDRSGAAHKQPLHRI